VFFASIHLPGAKIVMFPDERWGKKCCFGVSPKTEERTYVIVAANKQELYVYNALLTLVCCDAFVKLCLHALAIYFALVLTCFRAEWVQSINLVADPSSAQKPFTGIEMMSSWKMDPVSLREGYLLKRGMGSPTLPCDGQVRLVV